MSHINTYQNKNLTGATKALLEEAANAMGYTLDWNRHSTNAKHLVSGEDSKNTVDCCFVRQSDGEAMPFGLVVSENEDGTFEASVKGDFYATGINQAKFTNDYTVQYSCKKIEDGLVNQYADWNFMIDDSVTIENEEGEEEEYIEYTLTRMV